MDDALQTPAADRSPGDPDATGPQREPIRGQLLDRLAVQRLAGNGEDPPGAAERREALSALLGALFEHRKAAARAIDADFGGRPREETDLLELYPLAAEIRHARSKLEGWMRRETVPPALHFRPARAEVRYQPLGVVGILGAWNYPLYLCFSPLVSALAAGNRVMIKPSELAPRSAELVAEIVAQIFPPERVTVVTGDAEVAAAFSSLPFDHLLFTGSSRVGKLVLRAAAENLTPVTLELGGKSPAIVHGSFPLEQAAERIWTGKLYNAGQTCLAPDYVLVPEGKVEAMVEASHEIVRRLYPRLVANRQYTRIAHAEHYRHLEALREDALARGARSLEINPAGESCSAENRVFPPTVLWDVDHTMEVSSEEIFGPILPIVPYRDLEAAIRYVEDRPRPLALYYFDHDRRRVDRLLEATVSGGVTVNDVIYHIGQPELPFGGVGESGMGHYHGVAGFQTFSKPKGVFHRGRLSPVALLRPPYGILDRLLIRLMMGRR